MNPSSERLWTRSFMLQFVVMVLAWGGHYMLVPTLPLFAVQRLSATTGQVGLLMGMMATSAI
ncbi:MAG: MFS transporter, partial [Chloroflexi bacterium]|nr:MFS transporter [Chloroflexota bacterium]